MAQRTPLAPMEAGSVRHGGPDPIAPIDVSLVVSTIGRPTELARLLDSIRVDQADGPTVELIVVDQSRDGAVLPLLEANSESIRWIHQQTALGVSLGRNAGLAVATGRYVMFPDDDAWLPSRTLSAAVNHLDRHPEHAGLCARLEDARGRPSMLRWAPSARLVTKHNHHRTSIGSTMLFRTEVARSAGGFDPGIGPGAGSWLGSCEDADFLLRIIGDGWAVWYDPGLTVHHRDSRRDGGPEAESKALAYGCGQGHMWRTHGFASWLIVLILTRRLAGGLVWALRGRSDIGRAHRAWGRGAINGLLRRPPADLPGPAADGPSPSLSVARGWSSRGELYRVVAPSVLGAAVAIAATFAITAIAARLGGSTQVVAVTSLMAGAMVGAALAQGWWIQRRVPGREPVGAEGRKRRSSKFLVPFVASTAANGDVWLGALLLDGEAAAGYGTVSVTSALIAAPMALTMTALAPWVGRSIRSRDLTEAQGIIHAVATVTLLLAAAIAALAVVAGDDLLRAGHGREYGGAATSLAILLAGDLVAAALGSALIVLLLAGRHRLTAKLVLGWLALIIPATALATLLGGATALAVAAASSTAGLYFLLTATAWVTTGISFLPRLRPAAQTSAHPSPWSARSGVQPPRLPTGQRAIEMVPTRASDDPVLSLIVSTIGRPVTFERMIDSISRESGGGLDLELIVIDQSDGDETLHILQKAKLPFPWRHVRSERGLSLGRNTGLSLARGRYVTFPDDDVWYGGAMLAPAVGRLDRAPRLAGLCGRLAVEDGSDSMLRWAHTPMAVTHRNHHRTSIGPVIVLRREVACRIGGFDQTLGPGTGLWYGSCDDADFVLRVIESGESIWYDPDLHLHHRDPRLDGDPDTQRKSLAYGCGQGRMWRLHDFGWLWISFLMTRRVIGSVIIALKGHPGVGRAQRAWVRGALAGRFDEQPVQLRPTEPEPAAPPASDDGRPAGNDDPEGALSRPTTNEFVRGFKFRLVMSVIGMASTFALTVIAARLLIDAELAGFYALLASLAILPAVSRFGLNTKAVQELGAARGRGDWSGALRLADHAVRACLIPSVLTGPAVAIVFVAWASDGSFMVVAVLASLILVSESVRLSHSDIFIGLGLPGWGAALAHQVRAVAVVTVVAIDLVVFDSSMNLVRLLTIMAAVGLALAAVGQVRLWLVPGRADGNPISLDLRALARAGAPFALVDLAYLVVASGDIWLAGKAFEPTTAAIYSTASVLSKQIVAPIGLANIALAPVAAGYLAQGRTADLERIVRAVLSGLALLLLPGLIAVAVLGDRILALAYGDRFEAAHVPFAVLLVGYGAVVVLGLSRTVLLMAGGQRLAMYLSLGWTAVIAPIGIAAAVFGGPTALAVASAGGTAGLVAIQAGGAWITTGIRVFPSPEAVADLFRHRDRLSRVVPIRSGARGA